MSWPWDQYIFFFKDPLKLWITKFPSLLQHYGSYSFLIKTDGSFSFLRMKFVLRLKCKGILAWVLLRVSIIQQNHHLLKLSLNVQLENLHLWDFQLYEMNRWHGHFLSEVLYSIPLKCFLIFPSIYLISLCQNLLILKIFRNTVRSKVFSMMPKTSPHPNLNISSKEVFGRHCK